jgi:hypothetical protein
MVVDLVVFVDRELGEWAAAAAALTNAFESSRVA